MKYETLNGKTIQQAFDEYDKANPEIYELFKKFASQVIERGRMTSSKLIINRIRWEVYTATVSSDEFKINDAFSSRYVRKYLLEFPEHEGAFNLRELRSN